MQLPNKFVLFATVVFLVLILTGYILGLKSGKLFSRKFEFLSGIFYIVIAIIIAVNR